MTAALVELDRGTGCGTRSMRLEGFDVGSIGRTRIGLAPVVRLMLKRKLLQDVRNTADVVKVVVTDEKVVDLGDVNLVQIGHRFGAVLALHILSDIEQYDFAPAVK